MATRKSFAEKQTEYEDLKRRAHQKVDELTISQLRKFLAAYNNPGGWKKQELEPQLSAAEE
jgi:hypothetical protein